MKKLILLIVLFVLRFSLCCFAENEDKIKYVIGKLSNKTKEELEEGTTKATEAVTQILKNGIDTAMNKFN